MAGSVRRLLAGSVVVASVGGIALSLALAPLALAADQGVDIAGFAFSPQTITVAVGDTVTWTNADAQGHTATADDGSFDTGRIAGGGSASATFPTAGTFAYHCSIHRAMTATIVVQAAASPPATDSASSASDASTGSLPAWILLATLAAGGAWLAGRRFGADPRRP